MRVPLFESQIGMGLSPQATSLGASASRMQGPDFGPSQMRAQFEGNVRAEQRQLDERLINAGFQLAHQAIKAREEVVFQRQKRAFMYGDDPEERNEQLKARVQSIVQSARTNERTLDGNIVYDSQKAGGQIRSVAELQEFLAQTSYQNWEDIIDEAIPMMEDHVLSNSGTLARGRFREWVKDSAGDMRMNYTLRAAQTQMNITRQGFDDQIQASVASGDTASAMNLLYAGLNQGIYGAHEVVLISNRISNEAPLHMYTNEGLAGLRQGGADEADTILEEYLEGLERKIVTGNPVQRNDEGEYIVRGVTEAQFNEIRNRLTSERDKIVATDIRQKNTMVDVAAANLYSSMVDGTLTVDYLDNQGLVDMRFGPARALDSEYRDLLARMQQMDLENMQVGKGEQVNAARDAILNDYMEEIMAGHANDDDITAMVRHLATSSISIDGEEFRIVDMNEAEDLIKDFKDLHRHYSPYRDVYDSFDSALDRLSASGTPEEKAQQEIMNGRMRTMFRTTLNDYLRAETPSDQLRDKMRQVQQNLIQEAGNQAITEMASNIQYPPDMVGVGRVLNTFFTDDTASISPLALGRFNTFQTTLDEGSLKGLRSDPDVSSALFGHSLATQERLQREMGISLSDTYSEPSGQPVISVPLTVNGISANQIPDRYKRFINGRDHVYIRYQMIDEESVPVIKDQDLMRWEPISNTIATTLGFVFPEPPETRPLTPAEIERGSRLRPFQSTTETPVDTQQRTQTIERPPLTTPDTRSGSAARQSDTGIMGRPSRGF